MERLRIVSLIHNSGEIVSISIEVVGQVEIVAAIEMICEWSYLEEVKGKTFSLKQRGRSPLVDECNQR